MAKQNYSSFETLPEVVNPPFNAPPGIADVPLDFMIQIRNFQNFYALLKLAASQTAAVGQNTILFPGIKTNTPNYFKYAPATGKLTIKGAGIYAFFLSTRLNASGYGYDISAYDNTNAALIGKQDYIGTGSPLNAFLSTVYEVVGSTPIDVIFRLNNGDASSHSITNARLMAIKVA